MSGSGVVQALFIVDENGALQRVEARDLSEGPVGVVLDQSPFYAEAGGQKNDVGVIQVDGVSLEVRDVQAYAGLRAAHVRRIIRFYKRLRLCTVKSRRGKQKKERHQPLHDPRVELGLVDEAR